MTDNVVKPKFFCFYSNKDIYHLPPPPNQKKKKRSSIVKRKWQEHWSFTKIASGHERHDLFYMVSWLVFQWQEHRSFDGVLAEKLKDLTVFYVLRSAVLLSDSFSFYRLELYGIRLLNLSDLDAPFKTRSLKRRPCWNTNLAQMIFSLC